MTATRSRKEEVTYKNYLRTIDRNACQFCDIDENSPQLLKDYKYHRVIKNIFGYSIWDGQKVVDHLMIIPKRHTDNLSQKSDQEKIEYVDLVRKYESRGYNTYSRAPSSAVKSVIHQHTHLIKTIGQSKNFVFMMRKPFYWRIVK
jgi:diadenosine tetraphosphate (Ap4A) HIT family hydrolase